MKGTLPCTEYHENIQISINGNSFIFSISKKMFYRYLNIFVIFSVG